jgi:hypothetical protein
LRFGFSSIVRGVEGKTNAIAALAARAPFSRAPPQPVRPHGHPARPHIGLAYAHFVRGPVAFKKRSPPQAWQTQANPKLHDVSRLGAAALVELGR